jgi:hypothetical protein
MRASVGVSDMPTTVHMQAIPFRNRVVALLTAELQYKMDMYWEVDSGGLSRGTNEWRKQHASRVYLAGRRQANAEQQAKTCCSPRTANLSTPRYMHWPTRCASYVAGGMPGSTACVGRDYAVQQNRHWTRRTARTYVATLRIQAAHRDDISPRTLSDSLLGSVEYEPRALLRSLY